VVGGNFAAMALTIEVDEAKEIFAELVERVEAGEEVIFARSGNPVARLVPVNPVKKGRRLGVMAGRVPQFSDAEWEALDVEIRESFRF
jgi:prevent-host-death family protein